MESGFGFNLFKCLSRKGLNVVLPVAAATLESGL